MYRRRANRDPDAMTSRASGAPEERDPFEEEMMADDDEDEEEDEYDEDEDDDDDEDEEDEDEDDDDSSNNH
jgi:hypothetical protein